MSAVGLPAMYLAMRLVRAGILDTARALARPILCSALLAGALMVLLDATSSLSPLVSLLILIGGGLLVFSGSAAIFARPVLTPMWVSIRESRS
jgi:hypothetical protein